MTLMPQRQEPLLYITYNVLSSSLVSMDSGLLSAGYGYAATAAGAFLDEAKQNGASVHFSEEVQHFSLDGKKITGKLNA